MFQVLFLLFAFVLGFFLARHAEMGNILLSGFKKLVTIATSKRFLTLMVATWFVYEGKAIDPNWLLLAGFFIGIDTLQNNQVFIALAEYLKTVKKKN